MDKAARLDLLSQGRLVDYGMYQWHICWADRFGLFDDIIFWTSDLSEDGATWFIKFKGSEHFNLIGSNVFCFEDNHRVFHFLKWMFSWSRWVSYEKRSSFIFFGNARTWLCGMSWAFLFLPHNIEFVRISSERDFGRIRSKSMRVIDFIFLNEFEIRGILLQMNGYLFSQVLIMSLSAVLWEVELRLSLSNKGVSLVIVKSE